MSLAASPDGQWVVARQGRELALYAGGAAPIVGRVTLDTDDADHALVGPPNMLVVVTRGDAPRVVLHQPPYLDAVARIDLDTPMRIAAVTGPRIVLVSADGKQVQVVRIAGRALATQLLELESPPEFAVGLERSQILFGLLRKLEVWDAVAGRPVLRMQLQLPPPPRTVGAAHGHLWVTRPDSPEVFVYRLSDGRPFRHAVGANVEAVIHHPLSPVIVVVTARGLVRLHCFAHSLTVLDAPWAPGTPLAIHVSGEDIGLLGLPAGAHEPWRVPLAGTGAPVISGETAEAPPAPASLGDRLRGRRADAPPDEDPEPAPASAGFDRLRAVRERSGEREDRSAASREDRGATSGGLARLARGAATTARGREWREAIATYALELARGADAEVPVVAVDSELGELAHRLGLGANARRLLIALYGLYLVGEPALSIASLAHALGDWREPLGQGDLGALALLDKTGGRVALRPAVTELLDGAAPRAIRLVGDARPTLREGAFRLAREGHSDAELEAALATQLGRVAVIDGELERGLLEARLHGATAVAFAPPAQRPAPWPRGAGLVLVLYGSASSWIADLPALA